ncbi:MAG: hypothetical protein RUMPE_00343 [Eubacteriales bacterium SKADARSKE-1]|nr:hypothetical protein [Eubacteriales bacterium SKADARSKE-1]
MFIKKPLNKAAKKIFLLVLSLSLLSGPIINHASWYTNSVTPHEMHAATKSCDDHTFGDFNGSPACIDSSGKLHICENNFPDKTFMSWVGDSSNISHSDAAHFTSNEIDNIKTLDISSKGIVGLDGIQFFTGLTELNCADNQISSLDLSQNVLLENLHCNNNRLTSLNLEKNTKLSVFDLSTQTSSATKYSEQGVWKVDLNDIIDPSNLANVSVIDNGSYDSSTGIITYTSEPSTTKYIYTIKGTQPWLSEPVTMGVTLTLAENFDQWIKVNGLWFGVHAEPGVFDPDSNFHVEMLTKGTDAYSTKLNMLDSGLKEKVEEQNILLFNMGVTKPDGSEYKTLDGIADIYIQQPQNWDYREMQAVLLNEFQDAQFAEAFVQINPNDYDDTQLNFDSNSDLEISPDLDGSLNFIKFSVSHFSPFAVYDELTVWDYAEHYSWMAGLAVLAIGACVLIYLKVRKNKQTT